MSTQPPHRHTPTLAILEAAAPIDALAAELQEVWAAGWHPLGVARLVAPDNEPSGRLKQAVLAAAISVDRLGWHPRAAALWIEQADELGAGPPWWDRHRPFWPQFAARHEATPFAVINAAVGLRIFLEGRSTQPLLEAPPSEPAWAHGPSAPDDRVLAKVRALLAKAESTDYEHEAEALSAKAQSLIARHSIDVALLAGEVDVPGGRRVYLDPPYIRPKFLLLSNIAAANGCRSCWQDATNTATVIGHQGDIQLVLVLYTSLLLQGTRAVLAAGPQSDGRTSTTRSWRNAFWLGYATRIGQRLSEATAEAREQHERTTGVDLVPVMAERDEAVGRKFDETFPRLQAMRTSVSNGAGLHAGHRFADRADLDTDRAVGGDRPQLAG